MTLASEYRRQFIWRDWPPVFDALPPLRGQTVLDVGCGVGDLAAVFVGHGAHVIGYDTNEELLGEARSRRLLNAEFRKADLRAAPQLAAPADGLWCSFTAAYFPDFATVLSAWAKSIKAGGWVAVTEVDDLFGHEPLSAETRAMLAAYAEDALSARRYDFRMGRKLRAHLERSGFHVSRTLTLEDRELSFSGPALPEVLEAWRGRLNRMRLLRDFCGPDIDRHQEEFLGCLKRSDHRSTARVYCCIGTKHAAR